MAVQEKYRVFGVNNFRQIPQVQAQLTHQEQFEIEVVGHVLPFKVNNYVIDQLIDWGNWRQDGMYALTFPSRQMLKPLQFDRVAQAIAEKWETPRLKALCDSIRMELNPNPGGQMDLNVPVLGGVRLEGIQHKYEQTVLFFPSQGQTCHAYCTFCFRWPQFVGMEGLKFAAKEAELLVNYLKVCPQVTDVLITGGDPLVMSTERLKCYIEALIQADLPGLQTIRIGTKALSYWPYRFTTDKDSRELLDLFRRVQAAGKHLAFMAHFNHPKELKTDAVKEAIARVRETGAVIRTQSPLMKNINDSSALWHEMWSEQVRLGMVPYYMFLARDTGAQHYFAVSLAKALDIFNQAYRALTGLARTVRGPCMSVKSGKVLVNGVAELANEKVFVLNFIQGRNGNWAQTPFFAKYDEKAIWLNDLEPAFGKEKFFFEDEATEIDACFLAEEALS